MFLLYVDSTVAACWLQSVIVSSTHQSMLWRCWWGIQPIKVTPQQFQKFTFGDQPNQENRIWNNSGWFNKRRACVRAHARACVCGFKMLWWYEILVDCNVAYFVNLLESLRILSLGRNNIKSLTGLVSSGNIFFLYFCYVGLISSSHE